jgi:ABC-2 type transport system ATP-binding protein
MTVAVRATGIVKTFGSVVALDGVTIEVDEGIIYGLLGPNGAGKTTLIRVLTTLLKPDRGSAVVSGVDVLADPKTARRHLGLAGQFAAVDGYLTGRENVEFTGRLYGLDPAEARRRADEILERIGLIEAAERTVREYSGGMKRRLDLAASMVGRPQVLFLDEPTTGVDPRSRIAIWDLIRELIADGTTILLTSQYLDEVDQLADRIGVIDAGSLVAEGTAAELKRALGGDVIELHFTREDQDRGLAALGVLAESASVDETTGTVTLPAPGGAQTLLAVVRSIDGYGVVPTDVSLRKPTLDEVFLALTEPGHERTL